jgi:hypothetical protein
MTKQPDPPKKNMIKIKTTRSKRRKGAAPAVIESSDSEPAKSPLPDIPPWQLVCRTIEDWHTFPEQFATSKHPDEKHLYRLLTYDIRPQVIEDLTNRQHEKHRQLLILEQKRTARSATPAQSHPTQTEEQAQKDVQMAIRISRLEGLRKRPNRSPMDRSPSPPSEMTREQRAMARSQRIIERELKTQQLNDRSLRRSGRKRRPYSDDEEDDYVEYESRAWRQQQEEAYLTYAMKHLRERHEKKAVVEEEEEETKSEVREQEDGSWWFDCLCGVSGRNHACPLLVSSFV